MRSLTRPVGLLVTTLFLSLLFTNTALAFECTNAGAGTTAPDDGGFGERTACGDGAGVSGSFGTAVGRLATANGPIGAALGAAAAASGSASTAVGGNATASGDSSTALGQFAQASGNSSTALGDNSAASGDFNTALGRTSKAFSPHSNATALGNRAQVEQSNAMVLGSIPGINFASDYVDVGIGTSMPQAPLHVERADGAARVMVMETQAGPSMPFQGVAQGLVRFELNDEAAGERWRFTNAGDKFAINNVGLDSPGTEMSVFKNGDLVIGGLLTENSDVNAKRDIVPVDRQDVLAKIAQLPIAEWSYKDTPGQRHVGPMAQDFHAAFGLGRDNKHIATLDTSGVALAGIQALAEENRALKAQDNRISAENQALRSELEELKAQQAQLQSVVVQMQAEQQGRQVLTRTVLN